MKQLLIAFLLPLLCSGCLSTSQNYVDEHYRGYSIVRGHLTKVEALESSKWEHLADGVAVEVAMPGCTIHIQQGEDEERQPADQSLGEAPGAIFLVSAGPGDRGVLGHGFLFFAVESVLVNEMLQKAGR